jgi:hypothetical protein
MWPGLIRTTRASFRQRAEPHHGGRPAGRRSRSSRSPDALARRIVFYPRIGAAPFAAEQRIGIDQVADRAVDLFVPRRLRGPSSTGRDRVRGGGRTPARAREVRRPGADDTPSGRGAAALFAAVSSSFTDLCRQPFHAVGNLSADTCRIWASIPGRTCFGDRGLPRDRGGGCSTRSADGRIARLTNTASEFGREVRLAGGPRSPSAWSTGGARVLLGPVRLHPVSGGVTSFPLPFVCALDAFWRASNIPTERSWTSAIFVGLPIPAGGSDAIVTLVLATPDRLVSGCGGRGLLVLDGSVVSYLMICDDPLYRPPFPRTSIRAAAGRPGSCPPSAVGLAIFVFSCRRVDPAHGGRSRLAVSGRSATWFLSSFTLLRERRARP